LADWLQAQEEVLRELGKVGTYASNSYAVDTTNQETAARNDRATSLVAEVMASLAFAEPEMLALGFDTLRRWLDEEPRLAIYGHFLKALERRAAHVRSPEVEELLGHVMDPFAAAAATHGILADADLSVRPARSSHPGAEPIPVVQGNLGVLLSSPDREVRRTTWESYADAHLALKNTMANCLAAGVKQNVFVARARHYNSALEAAVARNHIPVGVFRNVVDTFRRNLPVWHRYWRVRRQALGYERLHVYDCTAPLTRKGPLVPFSQAVTWICEGMRPLGEDYVNVLRRGVLEQRWVDILPNKGKRAGAFSSGAPGTHPFVLMSYTGDLHSLSTLAHELGHSLHSYHTWSTQPFVYADYSIFIAEVASNFNQAMVREHLFASHPERDFQIALIEELMSNFQRYFFIMPTLARFELEIHQRVERGEALTADSMTALMSELFAEGYGGEVEIDAPRIGITWAEFSTHLYSNFYVYQYTTGISAAHALVRQVLSGMPGAAERYLAFLRAGASLYPLDALKLAGVDLATPEPIEATFAYLDGVVGKLAQLVEAGGAA
jgi:oligoendopeptidase F